ncbi:hypothetical protein [Vibrio breoganii]|uniref:hypothetical protein n=1 Tax=Vibrio breoganii TaxID=553239 RepID=UPI000C85063B|nr:hypothetical protein [Vibrio breoganii]PMK30626.1 hypothetical protein BCU03_09420 [Vibrio breoganii]
MTTVTPQTALASSMRTLKSHTDSFTSLIERNEHFIREAMNQADAEYNALYDDYESAKKKLESLELAVLSNKSSSSEEVIELKKQLTAISDENVKFRLKLSTYNELKEKLQELQKLDPVRLKKKNVDLRKVNDERLEANRLLLKSQKENKKRITDLELQNSTLNKTLLELGEQLDKMQQHMLMHDGDITNRIYKGENGFEAYIYIFNWGLTHRPRDSNMRMVNDFPFHIEVRTNIGIGVIVSPTEWGIPLFPNASDLEEFWPDELSADLKQIFLGKFEEYKPHLVDRIDWASETYIDDLSCLTDKQKEMLNGIGATTIYTVLHVPPHYISDSVKGLGVKGAKEIQERLYKVVSEWERENWTKEQRGLN